MCCSGTSEHNAFLFGALQRIRSGGGWCPTKKGVRQKVGHSILESSLFLVHLFLPSVSFKESAHVQGFMVRERVGSPTFRLGAHGEVTYKGFAGGLNAR